MSLADYITFIAGLYAVGARWIHIYGAGRREDERCGKDLSRIQKKSSKRIAESE